MDTIIVIGLIIFFFVIYAFGVFVIASASAERDHFEDEYRTTLKAIMNMDDDKKQDK